MDACAYAATGNSATQTNPASIRNARNIYRCLLLDNSVVPWNTKGSRLVTEHDLLAILEREGKDQNAFRAARTRRLGRVSVDRQFGPDRQRVFRQPELGQAGDALPQNGDVLHLLSVFHDVHEERGSRIDDQ